MKRTVMSLGLALALAAGLSVSPLSAAPATQPSTQPATKWVCPMGCESSYHPGKCSKCGMELKQEKPRSEKPKDAPHNGHGNHDGHKH